MGVVGEAEGDLGTCRPDPEAHCPPSGPRRVTLV